VQARVKRSAVQARVSGPDPQSILVGNEAFKAGKLEIAITLYDRAVEVLEVPLLSSDFRV
jgi:hypothetical protein